jgi:hypothetical protein
MVISRQGQNSTNAAARAGYSYTQIPDDIGLLRCPHLSGTMPSGDNVGMLDDSARWRKFNDMVPRSGPNGFATVWW